jgi:zinc protease
VNDVKGLYNKITANLNGMVLVFSGNINEASFGALVEKYIASIATKPEPVVLNKENLLKPVTGNNTFTFKAGKENKSEINHSYYGKLSEVSASDILAFGLLAEILQMQATKKLREEMGNTYSPKVGGQVVRPPLGDYNLALTVSSLPENADKIVTAFDGLVSQLIKGEWDEEDLKKAKAQRIKVLETQIKTNSYWANVLEQQYLYNYDTKIVLDYAARTEAVTKADITNTAKKFLSNCNVLKGIMNPE